MRGNSGLEFGIQVNRHQVEADIGLADLDAAKLQAMALTDGRPGFQIVFARLIGLHCQAIRIRLEDQLERRKDFLERFLPGHYGLTEAAPRIWRVTRSDRKS